MGERVVAVLLKPLEHHIVGGRPNTALPISAQRTVIGVVCRERRHAAGALELLFVVEVCYKSCKSFGRNDVCEECPIRANRLDLVQLSVLPKIVVESIILVPELVVDDRGQMLDFFFELFAKSLFYTLSILNQDH